MNANRNDSILQYANEILTNLKCIQQVNQSEGQFQVPRELTNQEARIPLSHGYGLPKRKCPHFQKIPHFSKKRKKKTESRNLVTHR